MRDFAILAFCLFQIILSATIVVAGLWGIAQ